MKRTLQQFRRRMPLSAAYADENGWVLENGKKHPKLVKGKMKYPISRSASDHHADQNMLSDLNKLDRGMM